MRPISWFLPSLCAIVLVGAGIAARDAGYPHQPHHVQAERGYRYVDDGSGESVIAFHTRGAATPNVWSYMDGDRVRRMEFDQDGDMAVDRWEYYAVDGTLERAYQRTPSGGRELVRQ